MDQQIPSTYYDGEAWDLSDDCEEMGTSSLDLDREWSSRQTHFHTLGYRDGIEAGKKSSVQKGFELGFSEGIKAGFECGLARGWTGAFTALPESVQKLLLDDSARMQVDLSLAALSSISSDKALHLFYHDISKINTPKSRAEMSSNDAVPPLITGEDPTKKEDFADFNPAPSLPVINEVEKFHVELQSMLKSGGVIL